VGELKFRVLGPVEVLRAGQPAALGTGTLLSLLAGLLISPNRVVSAGKLADLVWDMAAPEHPHAALQSGVSRLRRLLGRDVIETTNGGYRICAGAGNLDLLEFGELVTAAGEQRASGGEQGALALLDDAVGLWRLPVLGNVNSAVLHREVVPPLTERYLDAHEERAELCLRLGRHRALAGELAALVRAFPFREQLTGSLMVALYRSGRPADALAAYETLRRCLVEELGADPAADLQDLHLRILRADPDLGAPDTKTFPLVHPAAEAGSARAGAPAIPRQLPADIPDFTGREHEASLIHDLLTRDDDGAVGPRIAMVVGPGGVGKTTIAVQMAHRIRADYPDGQLYVNLQGAGPRPVEPGDVLSRFLRAFGVAGSAIPADLEERAGMYRSVVADRRLLVVLDNAAGERQLRLLMPGGKHCAVVVTARARITGLPGGHPLQLGMLDETESVRLLGHVAGPGRVSGEPAEARALAHLCGGLPLALRIVGARLAARPHWRLGVLARRLEDGRRRLGELSHGDLDVRASIGVSYQGLAPAAQMLMRRVGLLDAPDFPVWVGAALLGIRLGEAAGLADALVDAQLLEVARDGTSGSLRYRCHDLVRDFARSAALEMEDADDRDAALGRVFGALLGLAEHAHRQVYGGDYTILHGHAPRWQADDMDRAQLVGEAPFAWFESERLPIMAAVRQGAGLGLDELCWDLAWTAVTLFEVRGYLDDWRTVQEQALEATRQAGNRRGEAAMLASLGSRLIYLQSYAAARVLCEQAADLFAETGDQHGQGLALRTVAFCERLTGRLDAALAHCDEARKALCDAGDGVLDAVILRDVAEIHLERGQYETAERCLTEGMVISRTAGSARAQALVLHMLGELDLRRDRPDQAQRAFLEVRDLAEATSDLTGQAFADLGLAETLLSQGYPDLAESRLQAVFQIAPRLGHQSIEARALLLRGRAETLRGELPAAGRSLLSSIAIFERCGMSLWQARALEALATVHVSGDAQEAAEQARRQAAQLRAGS
jgi:DNA-binding SARP family transcriptional activator/tetratricopeptide (TPR) repeat protein